MPQSPVPTPEHAERVKLRFFADKAQLFLAAQTIRPLSRHDFTHAHIRCAGAVFSVRLAFGFGKTYPRIMLS